VESDSSGYYHSALDPGIVLEVVDAILHFGSQIHIEDSVPFYIPSSLGLVEEIRNAKFQKRLYSW